MRGRKMHYSVKIRWAAGLSLAFLWPILAFGGQSLVLSPGQSINAVDPLLPASQSWRLEFQLHNLVAPPAGVYSQKLFYLSGAGVHADVFPDGSINFNDLRETVNGGSPCQVFTNGLTDVLVRFQRDVVQNRVTCELWNFDGTGYNSQILPITAAGPAYSGQGGSLGLGATGDLGFLRIITAILPPGSRPPTTADGGNWTEWKFDGNLNDSTSNAHNASGSATFVPTPNQVAVALPKTFGAPSWSNWVSLRAGFPAQLDGSSSYSLADGSSAVSFFWQELSGPSHVVWANRTAPSPTLTGLIFGTYTFALKVTDAANNSTTTTLQAGAVATDNNGVVVNANPNVDAIYGPMIAFGKNPWGWMDQRALTATTLRAAAYNAQGLNPPSWAIPGAGTVSYVYNGATNLGQGGTTLCSAITSYSQSSITVCNATKLDLSVLPTRILVGPSNGVQEEIRICSASGNVLTVCYDGRGVAPGATNDTYRAGAQAWANGSMVGQLKVTGTGTTFTSLVCPAATGVAPFPTGTIAYSTGTVTVTAGLSDATGVGTSWSKANNILVGYSIRIQATHGGTPFSFIARINSINSTSDMTMNRIFPADADSGTYPYQIVASDVQIPTLHYARTDGSDAQMYWASNGCESDTQLYLTFSHDTFLNGTVQTGKQYSVASMGGYVGAFGVNFYGEDLAHRALYYRSGWTPALTAANVISDQWATSPYTAGGDTNYLSLLTGGGVVGAIAGAVLDNRVTWSNLRGFVRTVSIPAPGACNVDDTRDLSYQFGAIALAAQFDPDTSAGGNRAQWLAKLASIYNWEVSCKRADNSWANSGYKFYQAAAVNVTNGSATATGTGFTPKTCYGIASGTITVTNGSAVATGTGFVNSNKITIEGTSGGSPFTGIYRYQYNSASSVTLAALWPGDSGTFPFMIDNNDYLTSIGTGVDDPQLQKNFACVYVSPTTLTLSRPWDGPTETAYLSQNVLAGYSQQPYMMGIKVNELRWASQVQSVNPSGFATLEGLAATWGYSTGYDPVTHGLFYGRVMQACEPVTTPPATPLFDSRTPNCNDGLDPNYLAEARALTGEGNAMISAYYQANPTTAAKSWGDTIYGSAWGYAPYTATGYYSDAYQASNLDDTSLGGFKWTGFFFGMGMAHQWPAARLGGVTAAKPRTVYVSFNTSAGASAQMIVTSPSGGVTTYQCGAVSPCAVQVDDRQGAHWLQILYLSSGGQILSQADPQLLAAQ